MIKNRSKSKIKQSVGFIKKQLQYKVEKQKKVSKQSSRQKQEKQNIGTIGKLSMTSGNSKKKIKNIELASLKTVSPLNFSKKQEQAKNQDQNFIQKLFSLPHKKQSLKNNFLLEQLIQNLVPETVPSMMSKSQHGSENHQSTDLMKQLHIKNQQVTTLHQQLQQLKLYMSNFIFKVFDLTVCCRKYSHKLACQQQNLQFNRKTDEVISYLDSIIRHWKLQQKVKAYCQNYSKKMNNSIKNADESRKRCHTQSLKIPIEDYMESLQNTEKQSLHIKLDKFKSDVQIQQNEQIMKILSKRSSGIIKQQQQIYIAIRKYIPKNDNEINIMPGDRITVLQKKIDGRWLGINRGKQDIFQKIAYFKFEKLLNLIFLFNNISQLTI